MGSETPLMLPIIDFSNIGQNLGAAEWDLVKLQVRKALEEYGDANIAEEVESMTGLRVYLGF